jgi:hypothetical protein
LALALSVVPAMAAHTASAVIGYYGVYYPVVGGGAIFTLTVKNNASSTHAINKVVLDFESSGFKVVWANGQGWSATNTLTTCTFQAGAQPLITPGNSRMFSTKVTLPWTIAQYDFLVTTYDSAGGTYSRRTTPKVNVSYASGGNADSVDLFHASSIPTANMLLPLGGDAKYDGAILRAGTVLGSALTDLAVSTAKLANAAVTSGKLAAASVGSLHLIDGAVTEAKIADAAVTTGKLADDAVTSPKIAAGSVTNTHLASDSVATANIQDDAVADDKIPDLWRTVNLPITAAQLRNGAVVSPDGTWVGVDFPVPPPGAYPSLGLTIEMPADWDPVANPQPHIELVWFADDSVNNRSKAVQWWLTYCRKRAGEIYLNNAFAVYDEWTTDPSDARVIQTTEDVLRMAFSSYRPELPNEVVFMRITRYPVSTGVELPDDAHLMAARLWYLAKR